MSVGVSPAPAAAGSLPPAGWCWNTTAGVEAVSIRRIAAELKARPMSRYSFIERKDDLFDQLVGEALVPGELPPDWREALTLISGHTRAASLTHPWILGSQGRARAVGPNGVRHVEQSLAALDGLDLPSERRHAILLAVDKGRRHFHPNRGRPR